MSKVIKVQYGDDIRRVPEQCSSLSAIHDFIASAFRVPDYSVHAHSLEEPEITSDETLLQLLAQGNTEKSLKLVIKACTRESSDDEWAVVDKASDVDQQLQRSPSAVSEEQADGVTHCTIDFVRISHPNWLTTADAPVIDEKAFAVTTHGVECSSCGKNIVGIRYKCFFCRPSFNLCEECENKRDLHDVLHPLIKIRTPEQCPDMGVVAVRNRNRGLVVVSNIGIKNGSILKAGESFFAGWRLKNESSDAWGEDCVLRHTGGDFLGFSDEKDSVRVPPAGPREEVELLVELKAPDHPGSFKGIWRVCTKEGKFFGTPLFIELTVTAPSPEAKEKCAPTSEHDSVDDEKKTYAEAAAASSQQQLEKELSMLSKMGFTDRSRNLRLLSEGKSVDQVVDTLVRE